jgi:hypothetical protein
LGFGGCRIQHWIKGKGIARRRRSFAILRKGDILSPLFQFPVREGAMPKKERDREIRRRRVRKEKMLQLRQKLADSKDAKTRAALIQKILKVNPQAEVPQR